MEDLKRELYAAIHTFVDALEAADTIADARFRESPQEKESREKAEVEEIINRIFPE